MIGILLLTHEDFGAAMLKSAALIVGELPRSVSLGLHRGDDISAFGDRVRQAVAELDEGQGVLVFADLFGASPYNATAMASLQIANEFKCISGLSFPMLLEALTMREGYDLNSLVGHCMAAGRDGIKELFAEMDRL